MSTSHKLYTRYARRKLHSGEISPVYPFESKGFEDKVLWIAEQKMKEILSLPANHLSQNVIQNIFEEVPGILPRLRSYKLNNEQATY